VPYEGAILKTILTDNELKSDWVHPNAKGYARLAEAVAGLLKQAQALP
jgi:lysophospholipase L1-like esterase